MAPPPPPVPPPPPISTAQSGAPSGQQINMLMHSIRQGTKLKKAVTIDKSGPFIAGKIITIVSVLHNFFYYYLKRNKEIFHYL